MCLQPNVSFVIPSLKDGTLLDCRLFAPPIPTSGSCDATYHRLTVVAHPYAPLGGSQDDTLVLVMVEQFLRKGYIVLTFNFRGANGSQGNTSLTGKGEQNDYMSVVAFGILLITQLYDLCSNKQHDSMSANVMPMEHVPSRSSALLERGPLTSLSSENVKEGLVDKINIVMAGYSYGSYIASLMPSILSICEQVAELATGKAAEEIRLRARHLARELQCEHNVNRVGSRGRLIGESSRSTHSLSMVMGEEDDRSHRLDQDTRRWSLDGVKGEMVTFASNLHARSKSRLSSSHSPHIPKENDVFEEALTPERVETPNLTVSFLLLSPILPPLSSLLTGFSDLFSSSYRTIVRENLQRHPTLVVFGKEDGFTSCRKMQKWAKEVQDKTTSNFQAVGIEGAGHFWREVGVKAKLKETLSLWIDELGADNGRISL